MNDGMSAGHLAPFRSLWQGLRAKLIRLPYSSGGDPPASALATTSAVVASMPASASRL